MKKDEIRLVQYEGKVLRYAAKFSIPKYEADKNRQFIISFFLSDKTVKIFEPIQPNSGIQGGKFLERRIIRNPTTGKYFEENDFIIGQTVTIASTTFDLLGSDSFTTKYLKGEHDMHEMKSLEEVEHLLRECWKMVVVVEDFVVVVVVEILFFHFEKTQNTINF